MPCLVLLQKESFHSPNRETSRRPQQSNLTRIFRRVQRAEASSAGKSRHSKIAGKQADFFQGLCRVRFLNALFSLRAMKTGEAYCRIPETALSLVEIVRVPQCISWFSFYLIRDSLVIDSEQSGFEKRDFAPTSFCAAAERVRSGRSRADNGAPVPAVEPRGGVC